MKPRIIGIVVSLLMLALIFSVSSRSVADDSQVSSDLYRMRGPMGFGTAINITAQTKGFDFYMGDESYRPHKFNLIIAKQQTGLPWSGMENLVEGKADYMHAFDYGAVHTSSFDTTVRDVPSLGADSFVWQVRFSPTFLSQIANGNNTPGIFYVSLNVEAYAYDTVGYSDNSLEPMDSAYLLLKSGSGTSFLTLGHGLNLINWHYYVTGKATGAPVNLQTNTRLPAIIAVDS